MKHKQGDKVLHHYQSYYVGGYLRSYSGTPLIALFSQSAWDKLPSEYNIADGASIQRIVGTGVFITRRPNEVIPDTPFF